MLRVVLIITAICAVTGITGVTGVTGIAAAQTTLDLNPTVIAPKTRIGIGVNGSGSWYNFVGAELVDDPSFEAAADANGFARNGWPWSTGSSGALTASVDITDQMEGIDWARFGASVGLPRRSGESTVDR